MKSVFVYMLGVLLVGFSAGASVKKAIQGVRQLHQKSLECATTLQSFTPINWDYDRTSVLKPRLSGTNLKVIRGEPAATQGYFVMARLEPRDHNVTGIANGIRFYLLRATRKAQLTNADYTEHNRLFGKIVAGALKALHAHALDHLEDDELVVLTTPPIWRGIRGGAMSFGTFWIPSDQIRPPELDNVVRQLYRLAR